MTSATDVCVAPITTPTPAEALSDAAIHLATKRDLDILVASAALIEESGRDRALLEMAHTVHVQRMAPRASDDFGYHRALRIIEAALRRLPSEKPSPFDVPPTRQGFLSRLRGKRA